MLLSTVHDFLYEKYTKIILDDERFVKQQCEIMEKRLQVIAQGDPEDLRSTLSHWALLIDQQANNVKAPTCESFGHDCLITIPRLLLPLAHFSWEVAVMSDPFARFLIGEVKWIPLSSEGDEVLERMYRGRAVKQTIEKDAEPHFRSHFNWNEPDLEVNFEEMKINHAFKIRRKLVYLGAELQTPKYWVPFQTNIFMSAEIHPGSYYYDLVVSKFEEERTSLKIHSIKQMQHVGNYFRYCKTKQQLFNGPDLIQDTEEILFYGSGLIVPRSIVLGNTWLEVLRAELRKNQKASNVQLSKEVWFAEANAYRCKNHNKPNEEKKQLLVCLAFVGNAKPIESSDPALCTETCFFRLRNEHGKSTLIYQLPASLVYPAFLVEYFVPKNGGEHNLILSNAQHRPAKAGKNDVNMNAPELSE